MQGRIYPKLFVLSLVFILPIFILDKTTSKFFLFFNLLILLSSLFFYKYSKKVLILLIFNFLLFILLIIGRLPILKNFSEVGKVREVIETEELKKDSTNNLVLTIDDKVKVESLIQDIKIDIKNEEERDLVLEKINYAITYASNSLDKNISKTYLDLAHIYELAVIYGIGEYTDKTLEAYNNYCLLEPYLPECYANIARFLALDKSKKSIALPYAIKALELSRSDEEVEKYNSLVNHIEKL